MSEGRVKWFWRLWVGATLAAALAVASHLAHKASTPKTVMEALRRGDVVAAEALLKRGVPADQRDRDGLTPLTAAADQGDAAMARLLLEHGADPNASGGGDSPLAAAVAGQRLEVVRLLLERGANPNAKDARGVTPLMKAVGMLPTDIVKAMLDAGGDPRVQDPSGGTALTYAAGGGATPRAVKMLIEHGADVNHADGDGRAAIQNAAMGDFADLIPVLTAAGARLDGPAGTEAVLLALERQYYATAQALIAAGADVNGLLPASSRWAGETPLTALAATQQSEAAIKLLLAAGADVNRTDADGYTALSVARGRHEEENQKVLRAAGADEHAGKPPFNGSWTGRLDKDAHALVDAVHAQQMGIRAQRMAEGQ